ncbi:MAG: integrase core domain-containing protein [Candidatus Aminicenantales bacterium]
MPTAEKRQYTGSVFRFVQKRDSFWRAHHKLTDDVDPQWKQVLSDCQVKITYALSPQARGKVERLYGWLQDRIVRTCARETVRTIQQARQVLKAEVNRYNNHQLHSTTGEIPSLRFQQALEDKKSLFREFSVPPPFQSSKDIFCLRAERIVNPYRKISFNNLEFKIEGVPIRSVVQLGIVPDLESGLAEIRFWYENRLVGIQKVRNEDLKLVYF